MNPQSAVWTLDIVTLGKALYFVGLHTELCIVHSAEFLLNISRASLWTDNGESFWCALNRPKYLCYSYPTRFGYCWSVYEDGKIDGVPEGCPVFLDVESNLLSYFVMNSPVTLLLFSSKKSLCSLQTLRSSLGQDSKLALGHKKVISSAVDTTQGPYHSHFLPVLHRSDEFNNQMLMPTAKIYQKVSYF